MKKMTLGIERIPGALRFVELRGNPEPANFGEFPFEEGRDLAEVLRELVIRHGIRAKDVSVVDATSKAALKIQTLPRMPTKELAQVLDGELEAEGALLGEELVGDFDLLPSDGNQLDVLLGRLPRKDLQTWESSCRRAGLRLQVLTSAAVALAETLANDPCVPLEGVLAIVDLGRAKTNMAILSREGLRHVREIHQGLAARAFAEPRGEGELDLDAIGAALDEVRATVEQIQRTIQHHERTRKGEKVVAVRMTGESTRMARLVGVLQHDLRIDVKPLVPVAFQASLKDVPFALEASTYAVAWGLAGSTTGKRRMNFAPGVANPLPRRTLAGSAMVMGAAVLVGVILRAAPDAKAKEATRLQKELLEQKATLESQIESIESIRANQVDWMAGAARERGLPSPDLRPYVAAVIQALPANVKVTELSFERGEEGFLLRTKAVAFDHTATTCHEAMATFVRALERNPLMTNLRFEPVLFERDGDDPAPAVVEFTIHADLASEAEVRAS